MFLIILYSLIFPFFLLVPKNVDAKELSVAQDLSQSQETVPSGPRPTLVICPLSVLSNWQVHIMNLQSSSRQFYNLLFRVSYKSRKDCS